VAIMDHGRLIALDTPAGHIATLGSHHRLHFRLDEHVALANLTRLPGVREVAVNDVGAAAYDLTVDDPKQAVPALFAWAERAGVLLADVRVTAPTLEDVFLSLTGHNLRD
jgi:ABC-2 type transport system ATP-binding protein